MAEERFARTYASRATRPMVGALLRPRAGPAPERPRGRLARTTDGWIYVIGDPARAGTGFVTLLVDDLDAWIERLALDAGAMETMPGGIRTLHITDPEGNTIQLGG